jgi:hypothetical protein
MKHLATLLLVMSASLSFSAAADAAAPVPRSVLRFIQLARAAADPINIPPEWDGIWTNTDSTYDCNGVLQGTSTTTDTLCGGAVFVDPGALPVNFECSGTVTGNTINYSCTGRDTVGDCVLTFTYTSQGTRTGDDSFGVLNVTSTVEGTGFECGFIPVQCIQINTHGHRTGPAPAAYCSTPARSSTWGSVKTRYR